MHIAQRERHSLHHCADKVAGIVDAPDADKCTGGMRIVHWTAFAIEVRQKAQATCTGTRLLRL